MLDHGDAARFVREHLPQDARLLFIGETRPYYFGRDALSPTAYDLHPLSDWVRESASAAELRTRLEREGMTHVVLNLHEFARLNRSYGYLAFSGDDGDLLSTRLKELPSQLVLLFQQNGVLIFAVKAPSSTPPGS
jgi:hypothetical protein